MASQGIFPTSVYGPLSEVYGNAVTQYANNPNGLPLNVGLQLGMCVLLFDFTICQLLKAASAITQYQACTPAVGNSNEYSVQPTTSASQIMTATNDRGGSTALVGGSTYNVAWMTTEGLGTVNVGASITGGAALQPSGTAGQLQAWVNTNPQSNLLLLNTTTTAGAYPVYMQ